MIVAKTECNIYLLIFLIAACSAEAPASRTAVYTYESAKVPTAVTSHVRGLPALQGAIE